MTTIEKIHKLFYDDLKRNNQFENLRGVWSLYYIEGAMKFKTLGFHLSENTYRTQIEDINKINNLLKEEGRISVGFGSTGWAYKVFTNDNSKDVCLLNNTYDDPRGTVIELDYKIGQKNTAFVAIRDNDKKVIGIIMIFSDIEFNESIDSPVIQEIYKNFSLYYHLLVENQRLTDIYSIFSNPSSDDSDISTTTPDLKENLKQILNRFLDINNQVEIPFIYILNKSDEKPDYIAFSEQVLKLIEYELKFCSYLDTSSKNCCYFKDEKECNCANSEFLREFFFCVICRLFKKETIIKVNGAEIKIELYAPNDNNELSINLVNFTDPFQKNSLASEKFTNEKIIQLVKDHFDQNKIHYYGLCIISRIEYDVPIIVDNNCYRNAGYRQKIRPSNFLPYYYSRKYNPKLAETYKPIEDNITINFKKENGKANHILSIFWNNDVFYELLNNHFLNKSGENIIKLLKTISYDSDKIKSSEVTGFTIYGIDDKVAKSFKDLGQKDYLQLRQLQQTILSATLAAISQVMARNMSHNIGSHVLSKLIQWFQINGILKEDKEWQYSENYKRTPVENILFDDLQKVINKLKPACDLKEGCEQIGKCIETVNELLSSHETVVFHNYYLLATFFDYLKARMDYLADVTTNTPVIENTKGIYNDIVKPFIHNRVLNDRISGIDGFKYEIIVCKPNRINGLQENGNGVKCKEATTKECKDIITDKTEDCILSLPNDILGCHAFYTILENIIRNTAKHGNTPKDKNTEFKIKIEEAAIHKEKNNGPEKIKESKDLDWNEFYAISIFDNYDLIEETSDIKDWTDKEKEEAGLDKSINEISRIQELVIKQNRHLNDSILFNNQLRHGAWGLIEMDASAAYLRKIDIELIDSDKYQITCLQGVNPVTGEGELAILQAYAEQEKYLGYRFFIRKPQEILIIADDANLILTSEKKRELLNKYKNAGVWIYDKTAFKELIKKQKVFPHKLVVIVGDDENKIQDAINVIKTCYSKRFYSVDKIVLLENTVDFINKTWKSFLLENDYMFYQNQAIFFGINNVKMENIISQNATYEYHGTNYCEAISKNRFVEIETSATKHYFKNVEPTTSLKLASWAIPLLVIDERMQSFAWKEKYPILKKQNSECRPGNNNKCYHAEGVPYHLIYEKTNINVPNPKTACNLNAQSFHTKVDGKTEYTKIINEIKSFIDKNKKTKYFIIIHLGIIEKLIKVNNETKNRRHFNKDNKKEIADFIKQELLGFDNQIEYDNIVVTSGRGTPDNIPEGIRYLNFSVVSQYLITSRNKYAFTEALFSARKTNKS